MKNDFKKGHKNENNFVFEFPGHFVEYCRRKETTQCIKWDEKEYIDRVCKRPRDRGKQESVAMGPTLATPDEENWRLLLIGRQQAL